MQRDAPVLKKVRRLDSIKLNDNDSTYFTKEGFLVDHPILTSCGIFEYLNPDGSVYRELRLPKYVFDEKSLESYKGKPIIITHEAGTIDKNNVHEEQVGTILSDGYRDGDDVKAEIIIHNTDAMKSCGLKELSLGYTSDLIEEAGEYNGEHYDAIQTNIIINHLALVETARAGDQARLNIDGKEIPILKGGKVMQKKKNVLNKDSGAMSPEELKARIEAFKKRRAERKECNADIPVSDDDTETANSTANEVEANDADIKETSTNETNSATDDEGTSPEDVVREVKERRDKRDSEDVPNDIENAIGVIAQQDEEEDMLLACIEALLADKNSDNDDVDEKCDEDESKTEDNPVVIDKSKTLNADSVDSIISKKLIICRIGDKLHMDGLDTMSIENGRKAIIKKVFPSIKLDGKSKSYVEALFDIAVSNVNKRKDVNYQRQQMTNGMIAHADGANKSMASASRKKMIEREGGNE